MGLGAATTVGLKGTLRHGTKLLGRQEASCRIFFVIAAITDCTVSDGIFTGGVGFLFQYGDTPVLNSISEIERGHPATMQECLDPLYGRHPAKPTLASRRWAPGLSTGRYGECDSAPVFDSSWVDARGHFARSAAFPERGWNRVRRKGLTVSQRGDDGYRQMGLIHRFSQDERQVFSCFTGNGATRIFLSCSA
jgi:hypothetical protein